jgi:hypothetical protein
MEIKASELEIIETLESYHLARYQGNLGIWSTYTDTIDWDATFEQNRDADPILLPEPIKMAFLLDDDCNHLLDPEFEGVFSCRVDMMMEESRILEAQTKAEFGY